MKIGVVKNKGKCAMDLQDSIAAQVSGRNFVIDIEDHECIYV